MTATWHHTDRKPGNRYQDDQVILKKLNDAINNVSLKSLEREKPEYFTSGMMKTERTKPVRFKSKCAARAGGSAVWKCVGRGGLGELQLKSTRPGPGPGLRQYPDLRLPREEGTYCPETGKLPAVYEGIRLTHLNFGSCRKMGKDLEKSKVDQLQRKNSSASVRVVVQTERELSHGRKKWLGSSRKGSFPQVAPWCPLFHRQPRAAPNVTIKRTLFLTLCHLGPC